MKFEKLEALFRDQLEDIYDAEKRIIKALPKMIEAAGSTQLQNSLNKHLQETQDQINRLEEVFRHLGLKAKAKTCQAIKGILEEGEEMIDATGDDDVRDAGLIAAAQKVEHYEIATYGCLTTWANQLGFLEAQQLLHDSLEEEKKADIKLSNLAKKQVNREAAQA